MILQKQQRKEFANSQQQPPQRRMKRSAFCRLCCLFAVFCLVSVAKRVPKKKTKRKELTNFFHAIFLFSPITYLRLLFFSLNVQARQLLCARCVIVFVVRFVCIFGFVLLCSPADENFFLLPTMHKEKFAAYI